MKDFDLSVIVERCFVPPVDGGKMEYWTESFRVSEETTIGDIISHLKSLDYIGKDEHPLRKLGNVTLVATKSLLKRQEKENEK